MSKLDDIKWQTEWAKENGMKASENVDSEDIEWLIIQAEKAERYEMMYHNTGAMFNRMTMKEKIERMENALKNIQELIDGNNYTPLLEDIYRTVNRGLGVGD